MIKYYKVYVPGINSLYFMHDTNIMGNNYKENLSTVIVHKVKVIITNQQIMLNPFLNLL